ncbi:NAD(P)/FAD-dependent oxidoreductase [Allorhizocola rhizosphaerae]|uniref:NAD(P)/FAD-dependent oxidoreductase n=1 Tax=Allorhizocola rhizosphaerae TaxID=1872709 RepID=UPI000E3E8C1F|nr:FAD-dependent monooxygenase [Allorhizocola rhizosphaerae]
MPRFDVDVLVVGGGPAGLAAARFAALSGLSAMVAEPRQAPVDKACGEGIMPGGLASLRTLGLSLDGVPFHGIAYVDGSSSVVARFANGPGLGVRRTALHCSLSAGVECVPVRVTSLEQGPDWVRAGGITARWLIAADGLHSTVRRCVGVQSFAGTPRRYGLRAHWNARPWSEFVEVWWSRLGEAYVTPVAPDVVGVAILSASRAWLDAFPGLEDRLGKRIGSVRGAGPLRQVVSRRVAGRVLFVGDSAGYEDALTGEGISLAVKQARAAIASIADGDPARYERDWQRITREYRMLTRGLVVATRFPVARKAIVPLSARLPSVFTAIVNRLAA